MKSTMPTSISKEHSQWRLDLPIDIWYTIHMLHKISQLCDKIDSLKKSADYLRELKYGPDKAPRQVIDERIAGIQAECLLIANDKSNYNEPHAQEDKE